MGTKGTGQGRPLSGVLAETPLHSNHVLVRLTVKFTKANTYDSLPTKNVPLQTPPDGNRRRSSQENAAKRRNVRHPSTSPKMQIQLARRQVRLCCFARTMSMLANVTDPVGAQYIRVSFGLYAGFSRSDTKTQGR